MAAVVAGWEAPAAAAAKEGIRWDVYSASDRSLRKQKHNHGAIALTVALSMFWSSRSISARSISLLAAQQWEPHGSTFSKRPSHHQHEHQRAAIKSSSCLPLDASKRSSRALASPAMSSRHAFLSCGDSSSGGNIQLPARRSRTCGAAELHGYINCRCVAMN